MNSNNKSRLSSINFHSMNFQLLSRLSSVQLRKMGFRQANEGVDTELERQGSKTWQNILLVITIVQFLIIVVMCTVSGLLGEQLCSSFVHRDSTKTTTESMLLDINGTSLYNFFITITLHYYVITHSTNSLHRF